MAFNPRHLFGYGSSRRSEEHTSELQSRLHLVCRLLLEKKKNLVHRVLSGPRDYQPLEALDTNERARVPKPRIVLLLRIARLVRLSVFDFHAYPRTFMLC